MSSAPILRPLAFGEVLDGAFTLYRRNFATFVGTALVPTLVSIAAALPTGMLTDPAAAESPLMLFFFPVVAVVTVLMWGALTHQASQAYGGLPVSVGEGLRAGASSFWRLFFASLLAFLGMGAVFVVVALVLGLVVVAGALAAGAADAVLAVVIGVVVAVVMLGGIVLVGALLFAVSPAAVVEGKGPLQSLFRSLELARGAVRRLMGVLAVTFAIVYLPVIGVIVLTGTFSTVYDPAAAAAAAGSPAYVAHQVLTLGVGVLTTPFMVSVLVVQYYDRRVRTEGLDVQALADRLATA
jgi:hypothetical protein